MRVRLRQFRGHIKSYLLPCIYYWDLFDPLNIKTRVTAPPYPPATYKFRST